MYVGGVGGDVSEDNGRRATDAETGRREKLDPEKDGCRASSRSGEVCPGRSAPALAGLRRRGW